MAGLTGLVVAVVAVVAAIGLAVWAVRSWAVAADRHADVLAGMVARAEESAAAAHLRVLAVLEESVRPVGLSPAEVARERQVAEDDEAMVRFDDSDPFDAIFPPAGRPSAAPLDDGDSPFGVPGLMPEWRRP
jgi:type II secretory pathway pseudopilin PulG